MSSVITKMHSSQPKKIFDMGMIENSLSERFKMVALHFPERIAIETLSQSISYQELDKLSDKVADFLLVNFGEKSEPVVVLIDDEFLFYCAIIGILKAGKFYVPLDIRSPQERNAYIVSSCGARLVLSNNQLNLAGLGILNGLTKAFNIQNVIESTIEVQQKPVVKADAPAYLIYTSGSTGKPKGVVQCHRNILHNCLMQTDAYRITADDRFSQVFSPGVMGAVRATFNALLNGATLCPLDLKSEGFVALRDWLAKARITILHMSSSLYRGFVSSAKDPILFQGIRLIILGGEAATEGDFNLYKQYFPEECIFCTGLGSTETCTIRMLLLDKASIPNVWHGDLALGYPVHGAEIRLIDELGMEVKVGEVGEISVSSPYLALGYWNEDSMTWDQFATPSSSSDQMLYRMGDLGLFLPDGCLIHMGRKDFQIKVRGNRVEAREVELAIKKFPGVKEVVIRPWKAKHGVTELCAFIVKSVSHTIQDKEIRSFLAEKLPNYMLPAVFIYIAKMPLTQSGKVDYQALPPIDSELNQAHLSLSADEGASPLTLDDPLSAMREIISDSLENASVITFTRRKLRHDYIAGKNDIQIDQLNLDSLATMEFCIGLELKTKVSITPEELLNFKSLDDLCVRLLD